MSDSISRSKLLKKIEELIAVAGDKEDLDEHHALLIAAEFIKEAPSVNDSVVRCRNCKHHHTFNCPFHHESWNYNYDDDDDGNGYCHRGEVKKGKKQ